MKAKTPTSRTGTCSKGRGFTLIELIVVLAVISVFFAVVLPYFAVTDSKIRAEARKVASILRYTGETAAMRKETIPLTFKLDDGLIEWIEGSATPDGGSKKTERLDGLYSVELQSRGEVKEGELQVFFSPRGLGEFLTVHLRQGDSELKVLFNPISGRAKIQ